MASLDLPSTFQRLFNAFDCVHCIGRSDTSVSSFAEDRIFLSTNYFYIRRCEILSSPIFSIVIILINNRAIVSTDLSRRPRFSSTGFIRIFKRELELKRRFACSMKKDHRQIDVTRYHSSETNEIVCGSRTRIHL